MTLMRRLAVQCLLLASRFVLAVADATTETTTEAGAAKPARQRRPAVRTLREPWTRARRSAPCRSFPKRSAIVVAEQTVAP